MHEEDIEQLGLTSGEARAYVSLLKLGPSTVGPISKKSRVASSKIYGVLDRLMDKGLVSFIIKEKTKHYCASNPSRLKDFINKKKQNIENNEKMLSTLIPYLGSLANNQDKQEAEIFLGEKGLMTAYDILIDKASENSTLRFLYVHDYRYDKKVYDFLYGRINYNNKKIVPSLKRKKMKWIGLVNTDKSNGESSKFRPTKPIMQRAVSIPLPGNIDITDNAILITIWSDQIMGILIQSREVAESFKNYFDSIWNN